MAGGANNATYSVDNAADLVMELALGGTETVRSSANLMLAAELENLVLTGAALAGTGNSLANLLTGTAGNNTLDGSLGADTMSGGAGNDTCFVVNAGDVVIKAAGGGSDTVAASFDYALTVGEIENLTLTGAAHVGTGNASANAMIGGSGADTIDGGGGADLLTGGAGDDRYIVDGLDTVVDLAGGGIDTMVAGVSTTQAAEVDRLELSGTGTIGTGNALDNLMTGGAGNQMLIGLDGNDTLDGGTGADTMEGGNGDDTYVIDDAGDVVVETATGGIGTVVTALDTLAMAANIENIRLSGAAHVAVGNAGNNVLSGASGDDTLDGGGGDDQLTGGAGNAALIGGLGSDTPVLTGNRADYGVTATASGYTITDFRVGSADGADMATGVEFCTFADSPIAASGLSNATPVAVADIGTALAGATAIAAGTATATGNLWADDTDADLLIPGSTEGLTVAQARAGDLAAGGALTAVTVATAINGLDGLDGLDGSLTLNPDGSYSCAIGNNRAATQALIAGQTVQEDFTYPITDVAGATSQATLSFAVNGADDIIPVASIADTDAAANLIAENAANGVAVGFTAGGRGAGGVAVPATFALVTDATGTAPDATGPFQIDPATGLVTVRDGTLLHYEAATSHVIWVKDTSADGVSAVTSFSIDVADVFEPVVVTPVLTALAGDILMSSNAAPSPDIPARAPSLGQKVSRG